MATDDREEALRALLRWWRMTTAQHLIDVWRTKSADNREVLNIPEESIEDVVLIIESGLRTDWDMITKDTEDMLKDWCLEMRERYRVNA